MAGVSPRRDGKYRFWYVDESGRRKWSTGTRDRKRTLELAEQLEIQARHVREGLVEPGHRDRQAAAGVKVAVLVELWRQFLVNKGSTAKHAQHQAGACLRVLAEAEVASIARVSPDAIAGVLARIRTELSTRTANHALIAVKGFLRWCDDTGRLKEFPKGLRALKRGNEEADRKRVRRALTQAEVEHLFTTTADAPDRYLYGHTKSKHNRIPITGPARVLIYRLALGTGFRAKELRTLTVERLQLDGDAPTVTVTAAYAKNGRAVVQPITTELAAHVRVWLDAGNELPPVPDWTADMLREDLERAGIPYETPAGVADFHATRHTFGSNVVRSGASVKTAQELMRHSTPTLTIGRYAHVDDDEKRKALGGGDKT